MAQEQVIRTLARLHRICIAGERGFNTASENVSNRGLKVLLKMYAQQRRQFAAELRAQVERHGGKVSERRSVRGIIHRGRIDIMATLTIGAVNVENVVLREVAIGEKAAIKSYKQALNSSLSGDVQALLQTHLAKIEATSTQISRLRGRQEERLLVQLFDREQDVLKASRALEQIGISPDAVEAFVLDWSTDAYKATGSSTDETVASGAVGGALWGSVLAAISAIGILLIPNLQPTFASTVMGMWSLITLSGTFFGALFGGLLGFIISKGIREEDAYEYNRSLQQDSRLVMLKTSGARAAEALQILNRPEWRQEKSGISPEERREAPALS
jgi:uncharacterized protein (TIGR02284 family)